MKNYISVLIAALVFISIGLWQQKVNQAKETEKISHWLDNIDDAYYYDETINSLCSRNDFDAEQRELVISKLIPVLKAPHVNGMVNGFLDKEAKLLKRLGAHREIIKELIYGNQDVEHRIALIFCLTHLKLPELLSSDEQTKLYNYLHEVTWDHSMFEEDPLIRHLQISACANMATLDNMSKEEIEKLKSSHPNSTIQANAPYYMN